MNKVTIIVPVYNEENTITDLIKKLESVNMDKEIIIVDDGSIDQTREILSKVKNNGIKIFFHDKNYGKGVAIKTGIKFAGGELIVIQDADLEYDPKELRIMVDALANNNYQVIYGSRFLKKARPDGMRLANWLANKILTLTANLLYNAQITDEATCYKMFRSAVLKKINLKAEKFDFCPEVTAKVRKAGHKIYEVPISYKARLKKEGKKIGAKDMVSAMWTLVKYRFFD